MRVLLSSLVAAVVFACGGTPTPPGGTTPTSPTSTPDTSSTASPTPSTTPSGATTGAPSSTGSTASNPPPSSGGPPKAWDSMSHQEKLDYMVATVLPKEKASWSAFDAKYSKMNCATCHGAGAKDGSFKMPNAGLPKLSVADGFKKHMDKTPDLTKFMMSKVVPETAALLGEKPYDPQTKQGFGCFACHTMDK